MILIRYYCVKLGVSCERFANVAGVSVDTVKELRVGKRARVTRRVSDAVCGVDGLAFLEAQSDRRLPAEPYREYLRRLGAAGWSRRRLQAMSTVDLGFARNSKKFVTARVAAGVESLFREVGDRIGPDLESARRMQARGWRPPAAYDESWRELVANAMYKDLDM